MLLQHTAHLHVCYLWLLLTSPFLSALLQSQLCFTYERSLKVHSCSRINLNVHISLQFAILSSEHEMLVSTDWRRLEPVQFNVFIIYTHFIPHPPHFIRNTCSPRQSAKQPANHVLAEEALQTTLTSHISPVNERDLSEWLVVESLINCWSAGNLFRVQTFFRGWESAAHKRESDCFKLTGRIHMITLYSRDELKSMSAWRKHWSSREVGYKDGRSGSSTISWELEAEAITDAQSHPAWTV